MAQRLILFLKAPVPGQTKTRLTPIYSPEEASHFYICFVRDILQQLAKIPLEIYYFYLPPLETLLQTFPIPAEFCFLQSEGDLGRKMSHAFEQLFRQSSDPVLIIGTDSPGLSPEWLQMAFQWLEQKEIVIGPTFDGGYYLLGMSAFYPAVFRQIAWSGPQVFSQTLKKIQQSNRSLSVLPPFYDVDTPQDLRFLYTYLLACEREGRNLAPETLSLLKSDAFQERLQGS